MVDLPGIAHLLVATGLSRTSLVERHTAENIADRRVVSCLISDRDGCC